MAVSVSFNDSAKVVVYTRVCLSPGNSVLGGLNTYTSSVKIYSQASKNCADFSEKMVLNFDDNCAKMTVFIRYVNNAKSMLEELY